MKKIKKNFELISLKKGDSPYQSTSHICVAVMVSNLCLDTAQFIHST